MDQHEPPAEPTDAEIDEVLAEFGGDHGKAIATLLQDLATPAGDYEGSVSRGFVCHAEPATRGIAARRPCRLYERYRPPQLSQTRREP